MREAHPRILGYAAQSATEGRRSALARSSLIGQEEQDSRLSHVGSLLGQETRFDEDEDVAK